MAASSTMLPLGTPAPIFALPDVESGRVISLDAFTADEVLLVMFVCAHCPYVVHVQTELAHLARDYAGKSVGIVAITSNDAEQYPQDAPAPSAAMARAAGWTFPLLYDASQDVARAYTAACTPDFFVFDRDRRLAYRGQLDDSRPGRGTPTGQDLRTALEALLRGDKPAGAQKPSIGCGIKWKAGKAPEYS